LVAVDGEPRAGGEVGPREDGGRAAAASTHGQLAVERHEIVDPKVRKVAMRQNTNRIFTLIDWPSIEQEGKDECSFWL
jgi:hypothetical protein